MGDLTDAVVKAAIAYRDACLSPGGFRDARRVDLFAAVAAADALNQDKSQVRSTQNPDISKLQPVSCPVPWCEWFTPVGPKAPSYYNRHVDEHGVHELLYALVSVVDERDEMAEQLKGVSHVGS